MDLAHVADHLAIGEGLLDHADESVLIVRRDPAKKGPIGELDLAVAGEVEETLVSAQRSGAGTIVLDMSKLTFIDSTGKRLPYLEGGEA
jgi:hypothetical protein